MIVLGVVLVLLPVAWFFARRSHSKDVRAGRDVERPTYNVAPPGRRMGRLKDGRL